MLRDPSVQCYSDHWKSVVLPFIVPLGLLYGLCLPLGISLLLYSNRNAINSPRFQSNFGFLTKSYRADVYWYELVLVLKKALFLLIPDFIALKYSSSMKLFASIVILIVFQILLQHFKPYDKSVLNRLAQQ